jgi:hypothetical protein
MNSFFAVIHLAVCSYQEPPEWGAYKPGPCALSQIFGSKELTNAFLKTTVCNNVSVLNFIVHYLLYVSAPIGGHPQVKCTQNILR